MFAERTGDSETAGSGNSKPRYRRWHALGITTGWSQLGPTVPLHPPTCAYPHARAACQTVGSLECRYDSTDAVIRQPPELRGAGHRNLCNEVVTSVGQASPPVQPPEPRPSRQGTGRDACPLALSTCIAQDMSQVSV